MNINLLGVDPDSPSTRNACIGVATASPKTDDDLRIYEIAPAPEEFIKRMRETMVYRSWPAWKRETRASNYPRPKVNV